MAGRIGRRPKGAGAALAGAAMPPGRPSAIPRDARLADLAGFAPVSRLD